MLQPDFFTCQEESVSSSKKRSKSPRREEKRREFIAPPPPSLTSSSRPPPPLSSQIERNVIKSAPIRGAVVTAQGGYNKNPMVKRTMPTDQISMKSGKPSRISYVPPAVASPPGMDLINFWTSNSSPDETQSIVSF